MWQSAQRTALGVVLLLGVAAAFSTGMREEDDDDLADLLASRLDTTLSRDRRDPRDDRWTLGPGHFSPYVSVGALSNMQTFFDSLKMNLEGFDSLPQEEKQALLGQAIEAAEQDKTFRPRATAAYLHALRNHRPSYKIRNFVEESEAANLRGANNYDPNLLWAGLGKRR